MRCQRSTSRARGSTRSCGRRTCRRRTTRASARLDELDLVAVGIFDERDHRAAALYRPGLARNSAAIRAHLVAGRAYVGYADRHVTERRAELVALDAVVVGELEHRGALLVVVADEGERVFLLRAIGGAQELHAEHLRIEADRALQVADAKHGMQESHRFPLRMGNV